MSEEIVPFKTEDLEGLSFNLKKYIMIRPFCQSDAQACRKVSITADWVVLSLDYKRKRKPKTRCE